MSDSHLSGPLHVTNGIVSVNGAEVSSVTSTITSAAGATNICTITIQLKDGLGNNIAKKVPFTIYSSSAADGLTLASAASTGYSVASGGLALNNGAAITTSLRGITSSTGGVVLSLTDTGKATSYPVLVVGNTVTVGTQLTTGSYG